MFNISFDFDPISQKITNVKIKKDTVVSSCDIELKDNKLVLSPHALELIGATVKDRIQVNYWSNNSVDHFPVIGKSEVFTTADDGQKLTASGTISFRGAQHDTLALYGEKFNIVPFKEGMWKLVKIEDEASAGEKALEDEDLNKEFEGLLDDLPF